jgi:hypothetical protein
MPPRERRTKDSQVYYTPTPQDEKDLELALQECGIGNGSEPFQNIMNAYKNSKATRVDFSRNLKSLQTMFMSSNIAHRTQLVYELDRFLGNIREELQNS